MPKDAKRSKKEFPEHYNPDQTSDTAIKLLLNRVAAISNYLETLHDQKYFTPGDLGLYNGLIIALNFMNGTINETAIEHPSEDIGWKSFPRMPVPSRHRYRHRCLCSHIKPRKAKHVLMKGMKDGKKETALLYEVNSKKYYTVSRHIFERDYKNMKKETEKK